jgi:transposase
MKKAHVHLTAEDLAFINELLSKGNLPVRKQRRAIGLRALHRGKTYQEVANLLNMSYRAVHAWGKKYQLEGLNFLDDKPRCGRPAEISGEAKAKITALACSKPPKGYQRWSLRLLADRAVELNLVDHISHNEVGKILKKTNYNPIEKDNGVSER